ALTQVRSITNGPPPRGVTSLLPNTDGVGIVAFAPLSGNEDGTGGRSRSAPPLQPTASIVAARAARTGARSPTRFISLPRRPRAPLPQRTLLARCSGAVREQLVRDARHGVPNLDAG